MTLTSLARAAAVLNVDWSFAFKAKALKEKKQGKPTKKSSSSRSVSTTTA